MELKEIIKRYEEGVSLRKLEQETGIDRKKISSMLKLEGIEVKSAIKGYVTPPGSHNLKAFKELNTETEAYWFGFLSADGSITGTNWHLELTLAEKDLDHLQKCAEFLSDTARPKRKIVKLNGKEYVSYRLIVCSRDICQNLIGHGYRLRKDQGIIIPKPIIDNDLMNHFLRGYFDGDGTIGSNFDGGWQKHYAYLEFFGYEQLMLDIQQIMHKEVGTTITQLTTHGKARGLRFGSWHKAKAVGDYLYKDATIYLPRRYAEYIKIVKHCSR